MLCLGLFQNALRQGRNVLALSCIFRHGCQADPDVSPAHGRHATHAPLSAIRSNKVVVFSKPSCPYCQRVKALFASLNVQPTVLELDQPTGTALTSAIYFRPHPYR